MTFPTPEHIITALLDWRVYIGGAIYFGVNCALASISAFLPTIITTFGYSAYHPCDLMRILTLLILFPANAVAQLLTVPPYAVAAIVLCMASYASDRLQNRGLAVAGACTTGAIGKWAPGFVIFKVSHVSFRLPPFAHSPKQRSCEILCCVLHHERDIHCHRRDHRMVYAHRRSSSFIPNRTHTSTDAHNLGSETKKATGMPMFMAIGQCGSILGSHIYPSTDGPRYMYVLPLHFVRMR